MLNNLIPFIGEDQAESFFNKEAKDYYHSKIGPITEARHKFVEPSCLKELLLKDKEVKILDLFFGLGYNTGVALDFAYSITQKPKIEITAIENDLEIIRKIQVLKVPNEYKMWTSFLGALAEKNYLKFDNVTIELIQKDIFEVINNLPKKYFNLIFFDPFSYKATPEFWEDSFLTCVFALLTSGGTLTTYSSLKRVEKLAINLGYGVERVKPIGRKKTSLVIKHSGVSSNLLNKHSTF